MDIVSVEFIGFFVSKDHDLWDYLQLVIELLAQQVSTICGNYIFLYILLRVNEFNTI